MVPIPKRGAGSLTDVKHYRGIALSSLFCKLFDTCINAKHYENLLSNSLQFAYKPNTSTVQCVSSIIETTCISYYLDKKVKYLCVLLMLQRLSIKLICWYFLTNYIRNM